jgi:hypothetical protein
MYEMTVRNEAALPLSVGGKRPVRVPYRHRAASRISPRCNTWVSCATNRLNLAV